MQCELRRGPVVLTECLTMAEVPQQQVVVRQTCWVVHPHGGVHFIS